MKDMNPDEAKRQNIVNMSFGFGAMTRLFKQGEREKIISELGVRLPKIASSKDDKEFRKQHDDFCCWFKDNIKTAERKSKRDGLVIKKSNRASYGQGAKVLDVALKIFVYYCQLPDLKTAKQTMGWLNAAIDTKMMKYLKKMPDSESSSIEATSIEDVDEETYAELQKLVHKDIKQQNFRILPVQWDDIMWRRLNNK